MKLTYALLRKQRTHNLRYIVQTLLMKLAPDILGPISLTSLQRIFVLKTSYEVCTLKIGFHQTIELCESLTFCCIFKTTI